MKSFVFTLAIVMCQYQNSSGTIIDVLASRFGEVTASILGTISNIRLNMFKLFKPQYYGRDSNNKFWNRQALPKTRIKKVFCQSTLSSLPGKEKFELGLRPYLHMSTPQMSLQHGRKMESHKVITKDGYQITAHRIKTNIESNKTIILHHGLLGSSADWILLGPTKSLPYLLNDNGYDVWMVNARGNTYSREHTWKKTNSDDYWKFSWQEVGEFDLPAIIDYIRLTKKYNESSLEKIDYIGHSMGATALLVMLSTSPLYNKYLRVGILMAPIAYMTNINGPLKTITNLEEKEINDLFKIFGNNEFIPSRMIPKDIASKYCEGPDLFCCNPLYFLTGGYPLEGDWDINFKATVLYHVPAGTSTNTILHYMQLVKNGKFHKFNDINYEFNLNQVTLPIVLISSDMDWLAPISDVMKLFLSIPNPVDHYIIREKNLSHTEFVWGLEANYLVFNKVLEYLNQVLNMITTKHDIFENMIL